MKIEICGRRGVLGVRVVGGGGGGSVVGCRVLGEPIVMVMMSEVLETRKNMVAVS